jgi:hypothetical protein
MPRPASPVDGAIVHNAAAKSAILWAIAIRRWQQRRAEASGIYLDGRWSL